MERRYKRGHRYDREFKERAVALYNSSDRTLTDVARELGVSGWSLGKWVEAANKGQVQTESSALAGETAEQREIRRLRMELEYVQRQRDILKKALSIVAEEKKGNSLQ